MQGNSIKFKGLLCALLLLITFSGSGLASGQATSASQEQATIQQSAARININQATAEQLSSLPGIGPAKAEAIILTREKQGRFTSTQELQAVKGIGEKTAAKLKPLISF
ncbi:ComEA family DNA-binding protein [Marinospirillum insulare]|uniref:Helix-hairpin-helix DNA-binding motif class 1 domain-containing protein n=1 Tax=Marinospirillum insulare TaxID=217169 RepID=A0ABQ5ZTW3_9GAMM|nr:ComEA family DNA-binding protein [Marinospirillum insulare]GLR62693.1 hypothetical protein GCM10007878_01280 [Marinospirillum insulare]